MTVCLALIVSLDHLLMQIILMGSVSYCHLDTTNVRTNKSLRQPTSHVFADNVKAEDGNIVYTTVSYLRSTQ
jgi:hypothetical protein